MRVSQVSLTRFVHALRPRDPHEEHRVASPLELFTDLCFVGATVLGTSLRLAPVTIASTR